LKGIGELISLITDETLASRACSGDLSAYEELVNRYKNSVFAIVCRMVGQYQEAEDITQEVFISVYEKLYQFDTSKRFSPWLYRIATNASISALRRKKKVVMLNFDETYAQSPDPAPNEFDPEYAYERQELREEILQAIAELPESYRVVIALRYQSDLNNQEIAEILGVSKENVEVKVHRARKALRRILQKRWGERGLDISELPANR
jgi:RNA polymerase sigma-70 factor (ECF subfamily)